MFCSQVKVMMCGVLRRGQVEQGVLPAGGQRPVQGIAPEVVEAFAEGGAASGPHLQPVGEHAVEGRSTP